MLLIECPHCGPRAETEFSYLGDASVRRPTDPEAVPLDEWCDYVYLRDNPRGPHSEWWQHVAGCRRWIAVRRDTASHQMLDTPPAREPGAGDDEEHES